MDYHYTVVSHFALNRKLADYFIQVGIEVQLAKSKCYMHNSYHDYNWDFFKVDIPNGILNVSLGQTVTYY